MPRLKLKIFISSHKFAFLSSRSLDHLISMEAAFLAPISAKSNSSVNFTAYANDQY